MHSESKVDFGVNEDSVVRELSERVVCKVRNHSLGMTQRMGLQGKQQGH